MYKTYGKEINTNSRSQFLMETGIGDNKGEAAD